MLCSLFVYIHFTISLKRDNIYKLLLLIIEEHCCLILRPQLCESRYKALTVRKTQFSYIAQNHSGVTIFTYCIYE